MTSRRTSAAIVAGIAWLALALLFAHQLPLANGSISRTFWAELAYFTEWTNLLVAIVFTGIALGWGWSRSWALGQALSAILLVVIGYWGLGDGLRVFGRAGAGDVLAHAVTPLAVLLFWLTQWPKGRFRLHYAAQWAAYPLAYLFYALVRGAITNVYPYSWLDVSAIGYSGIALPVLLICTAYVVIGLACIWLDQILWRHAR
jgi:hypothetical protein